MQIEPLESRQLLTTAAGGLHWQDTATNVVAADPQYTVNHTPYLQLGDAPLVGYSGSATDRAQVMWQTVSAGNGTSDSFVVDVRQVGTAANSVLTPGVSLGANLPSAYETSGVVWHSRLQKLLLVSDGGTVSSMNTDGSAVTNWSVGGDLEGITVARPQSNFVYLGVEHPDSIREFNIATGQVTRTFSLTNWMTGADNSGLEALTFVPEPGNPEGGYFYAGLQATGEIFVFQLPIVSSTTSTSVTHIRTIPAWGGVSDIADMHYEASQGVLYAVYDAANLLRAMKPDGTLLKEWSLPGTEQEGLTLKGSDLYIGEDYGGAPKGDIFRYSNFAGPWTAAGPISTLATGVGGRINHFVNLSGLSYDTEYEYRVQHLRDGAVVNTYQSTFHTRLPAGAASTFSFVAYGDSAYTPTVAGFKAVQGRINQIDPKFAILLGDNVYNDGTHVEFDARFDPTLNPEAAAWNSTHIDYYSFGNHDVSTAGGKPTEDNIAVPIPVTGATAPAQPAATERAEHNYSFDYGNVHFTTFDTNSLSDSTRLAAQLAWVQQDLAASSAQWKIVFGHHPIAGVPDKPESPADNYYQQVVSSLRSAGADLFMTGHSHTYSWTYPLLGQQNGVATYVQDTDDNFSKGAGLVQVVSGLGGREVRSGSFTQFPFVASGFTSQTNPAGEFGVTQIDVTPTQLVVKYVAADDGAVLDQFSITDLGLPEVTVTATDPTAAEQGANSGQFLVSRAGSTSGNLTVQYTLGGTAINGTDYVLQNNSVTIPSGQSSATITITPIDDQSSEGSETVTVALSQQAAYIVGFPDSSQLTIADNELVEVEFSQAIDTQLHQNFPDTNYASATSLNVDLSDTAAPATGGQVQALLRFDNIFGTSAGQIPLNASQINSATLQLQVTNGGNSMSLHRLLQNWQDSSTWNTWVGGVQTNGVEAVATADAVTAAIATGVLSIDVKTSLQAWLANPSTNRGWAFFGGNDGIDFYSAQGVTPPRLIVQYTAGPPEIEVLDGAADIADGTGSVSFGSTPVGTTVSKTFTVRNAGTANLTLAQPTVPNGYTLQTGLGSLTLAPGATTTFQVRLDAASAGTYSGSVSFTNNDGDENPFNFTVTGQVAAPQTGQIIDDTGATFAGSWVTYSTLGYPNNTGSFRYAAAGTGSSTATYAFSGLTPGQYQVYATWVENSSRGSNVPFSINGGGSPTNVPVNQKVAPTANVTASGRPFQLLATVTVTGSTLTVTLNNNANGQVIADAVRIERVNQPVAFVTERIASGLAAPTFLTYAPGDPNRVFITLRDGVIRVFDLTTDTLLPTPFLTIPNVYTDGEHGLLGLTFDPNYQTNGYFYTFHSTAGGDFNNGITSVVRWTVQGTPSTSNLANANSSLNVLSVDQPQNNHNGGWIAFGPNDGLLYVAFGDGGNSNDVGTGHTTETGNSQDITDNLLGKILRIDVNGDDFPGDIDRNYHIPSNNPFVGQAGDDEIWAYGLRNPFRNSFDRQNGNLYIGDVGQNTREEIDVQLASSSGGENYGWRLREGMIATPTGGVGGAKPAGAIDPIYNYLHGTDANQGSSVTGGVVYRGPISQLQGQYFFGDYVNDRIWSLQFDGSAPTSHNGTNYVNFVDRTADLTPSSGTIDNIVAFGDDFEGNLYIVDISGEIFRVRPTNTALTVAISASSFSENGGTSTATVTRTGSTVGNLVVTLNSSDTSEATVPTTVTILHGQTSASFTVTAVNDAIVDGTQTVTITASASRYPSGTDTVDVTDDDASAFFIDVIFIDSSLTPSQQAIFQAAANQWSTILTGDIPNVFVPGSFFANGVGRTVDDLAIEASAPAIDGVGGILGQAGPEAVRNGSVLPAKGLMQFDSADVANMEANGQLLRVILHEMGHVLGIGTIWTDLGLLSGAGGSNPTFTGVNARNEYNSIFGISATSVPVENTGGSGTRDSHWREATFNNELMTGFLDSGSNPLSRITAASMIDLGYPGVNVNAAEFYTPPGSLLAGDGSESSSGGGTSLAGLLSSEHDHEDLESTHQHSTSRPYIVLPADPEYKAATDAPNSIVKEKAYFSITVETADASVQTYRPATSFHPSWDNESPQISQREPVFNQLSAANVDRVFAEAIETGWSARSTASQQEHGTVIGAKTTLQRSSSRRAPELLDRPQIRAREVEMALASVHWDRIG